MSSICFSRSQSGHVCSAKSAGLTHISYFTDAITLPHTFEELRTLPFGRILTPLIAHLSDSVHHPALVSALLYVPVVARPVRPETHLWHILFSPWRDIWLVRGIEIVAIDGKIDMKHGASSMMHDMKEIMCKHIGMACRNSTA